MPVRFQVDPDFYDHPKTAGMSDAAFSLWVRAGSYSAAKLTDGFVAETVLVHTLRSDTSVADELVERGLWRRRRGGYVFHEWSARNLTKERVETHNRAEAERKRKARQKQNDQVSGHNVRPDAERTPPGRPPGQTAESDTVGVVSSSSGSFVQESHLDQGYLSPPPARARAREGTRIPDDFTVTREMVDWVRKECPHVDGRRATEEFVDYWKSRPGKQALKLNWVATWRNSMRRAEEKAVEKLGGTRPSTTDQRVADIQALKHSLDGTDDTDQPVLRILRGDAS